MGSNKEEDEDVWGVKKKKKRERQRDRKKERKRKRREAKKEESKEKVFPLFHFHRLSNILININNFICMNWIYGACRKVVFLVSVSFPSFHCLFRSLQCSECVLFGRLTLFRLFKNLSSLFFSSIIIIIIIIIILLLLLLLLLCILPRSLCVSRYHAVDATRDGDLTAGGKAMRMGQAIGEDRTLQYI